MNAKAVALSESWMRHLGNEFDAAYMRRLSQFLRNEKQLGKTIYPKGEHIFNALNSTPLESVKVVILGQDPYHGPGQAHGLCFSVQRGIAPPPSLVNIFKEINADLGLSIPNHGCLQAWAKQGVLLLNAVLTVEHGAAASHQGQGWEEFTDRVVAVLNDRASPIVFLLWGSHAQKKGSMIDQDKHRVFKAPHPSPLSAHRGFMGCRHFSKCNEALRSVGQEEVNWALPD